ncbi:hypothetical protein VP1G_06450 [Cytospora mali]|uniref:TM7S3/TM198-like domain-containing protein n=1 Tax=Cytospora mali TaxID=578113 RepID=A0A194V5R5_CYTMA|nr:hypothetical protein VP1G_06450 [Valsa mali var. pyri (nom. inval.)]
MRVVPSPRIWGALLCLFVCFNIVSASVARPLPRQDDASTTSTTVTPSSTEDAASSSTSAPADSTTVSVTSSSSIVSSLSTTASGASTTPTVMGGSSSVNSSLFNDTIPAGDLPLEPRITPGFSVAGVILILTGIAYTLIGIKTRWIHCFLSVAYLAAIGVTLLIIYVMNPPTSDGVQGAYVVAAVGTGALLGGGGLVFRDITECLGCLLGGFCLAMWLLTLKEGGLLGSGGGGVIIFIAVFSAAGFAGYFSRWTRSYYMIACISLSGATAIVIGIDCFSRAGLKEYWAWIWDLNDKLFPQGADTYPLTRGIRVEQALTVLIALIGVISQMRLWRIIKEHRAKKEEARNQAQAEHQEHEENVGRDIERANAHERSQWEAVYGDQKNPVSVHVSPDSVVGDIDSEYKRRNSGMTTTATTTRRSTFDEGDGIEMAEFPSAGGVGGDHWDVVELDGSEPGVLHHPKAAQEQIPENEGDGMDNASGSVDEAEADGDVPTDTTGDKDKVWLIGEDGNARLVAGAPAEQFKSKSATPTPELVVLPPEMPYTETDAGEDDGRSSVDAVADEDGELLETQSNGSKRNSFAKRLSAGSADLFRRMSHHPLSRQMDAAGHGHSDSMEDLTVASKGDNESVAATFDRSSDEGNYVTPLDGRPFSMEINAELASSETQDEALEEPVRKTQEETMSDAMVSTDAVSDKPDGKQRELEPAEENSVPRAGKSTATETNSGPAVLTKDRLPPGLSKTALTYRTNEWAKHLSSAEVPSPEERQLSSTPDTQPEEANEVEEKAAPVNVDELRKTAENATPPPAMPRSASVMSTCSANLAVPGSRNSAKTRTYSPTNLGAGKSPQNHLSSRASPDPRRTPGRIVEAIAEEDDNQSTMSDSSIMASRRAAAVALLGEEGARVPLTSSDSYGSHAAARPISSRPQVPGVISYDSPQTLIGRRDMLMRVKNAALRPESVQVGKMASISPNTSAAASDAGSVSAQAPPGTSNPNATGSGADSRRSSWSAGAGVPGPHPRASNVPTQAARGSRQSAQQDPRATPVGVPIAQNALSGLYTQPQGPLINSVYGIPGTTSTNSLPPHLVQQSYDSEVQRDMDVQRHVLMSRKRAEAQRRETLKSEREAAGEMFERRIRTDGEMLEMHRRAMRRIQRTASQMAQQQQ